MGTEGVDHLSAVKASLELMVAENGELHDYFHDLLGRVAELDSADPDVRRSKFKDMVRLGAFRFNGLDVRHFAQAQRRALPPPVFLTRTLRRLQNTLTLVEEFERKGIFDQAGELRQQIEEISGEPVEETDAHSVRAFRGKVSDLRDTPLFKAYQEAKSTFIRKDADLRADSEFLAAKELVEEGEETFRERGEELEGLRRSIDEGSITLDEAQSRLDELALPETQEAQQAPAADAEE